MRDWDSVSSVYRRWVRSWLHYFTVVEYDRAYERGQEAERRYERLGMPER